MLRTLKALTPIAVMMLAGTGASAQFVLEASAKPESSSQSTTTMTATTDDGVYSVKIVGGEVVWVSVDGDEVPTSRAVQDGSEVYVMDEDGKVLFEFGVAPNLPSAPSGIGLAVRPSLPAAPNTFFGQGGRIIYDDDAEFVALAETPSVMVGVNLSEVNDRLRYHLGLGDAPAIVIEGVIEGLPAEQAGLHEHDVVIEIDGEPAESLTVSLSDKEPGDELELTVRRGAETVDITIELVAYDGKRLGGIRAPQPAWSVERNGRNFDFFTNDQDNRFPGRLETERLLQLEEEAEVDAERIQQMIARAMEDAERQILELRDGQVFVRSAEELERRARELEERAMEMQARAERGAREHLHGLEEELESRIDRLETQMDRLIGALDRVIERIEGSDED